MTYKDFTDHDAGSGGASITSTQHNLTAYRRVSSASQTVDGFGLEVQEKLIRDDAAFHGHRIVGWETDPGITGTVDEAGRPGIMAVLRAIQDGESQGLYIVNLGRLSRLLTIQEAILAKVWDYGGVVITTESGEVLRDDPDDPMRTAMRQMAGVFFQLDRAMVVKRLKNGRDFKASQGGYAGGGIGFGLTSVDGELVSDEQEQKIRERLVDLRDSGLSLRAVADQLNAEGLPPRRSDRWYASSVQSVLRRYVEA